MLPGLEVLVIVDCATESSLVLSSIEDSSELGVTLGSSADDLGLLELVTDTRLVPELEIRDWLDTLMVVAEDLKLVCDGTEVPIKLDMLVFVSLDDETIEDILDVGDMIMDVVNIDDIGCVSVLVSYD